MTDRQTGADSSAGIRILDHKGGLWLSSYPLKRSQIFENSTTVRFSKDISMDFMAARRPDQIDPDLSGMGGATAASTPAWPNQTCRNYSLQGNSDRSPQRKASRRRSNGSTATPVSSS
jgi:hypothetical protein